MAKPCLGLAEMLIGVIWSLWCSLAMRLCSVRSCSRTSGMSAVRLGRCSLVSMPRHEAGAALIEAVWRGHSPIEKRLQDLRAVWFGEEGGQAAQGNSAQALAALRNGLLKLFRQAHWRSIPDALAHYAAALVRAAALIGLQVKT
jgi:hypothetical protein